MAISEVFPKPTVKEVHFQIRFPNLFFIERKIGDFQLRIMRRFPESRLVLKRHFLLGELPLDGRVELQPDAPDPNATEKIWQFDSKDGVTVNVATSSLGIHSTQHKTYDHADATDKFRDVIELVVAPFLEITSLPILTRIGLRYIDLCPIPSRSSDEFAGYYNSALPLQRFKLEDARELQTIAVVRRGDCFLRYAEAVQIKEDGGLQLKLDFDGFTESVDASSYLNTTDRLHDTISAEYESSIKEPVYAYMRGVSQ